MPAADSGSIKAGDTPTGIDNVDLKATQSEAVAVFLTGPPESEVELELLSVNGIPTVVTLTREALCLNTVSWARVVLPLRIRRLELVEPSEALSEAECVERDELVACYLRICGKLAAADFRTFDSIPRWSKSITLKFSCPKVRGILERDVLLLSAWLTHLRTREKHLASLKMLKVKPTCLPSIETAAMRSKAKSFNDIRLKTQRLKQNREESKPDVPLYSKLKLEIDRILAKCDLLWVNWMMDGVLL